MTNVLMKPDIPAIVRAAIKHHGNTSDAIIPILNDVNREVGYLPSEALIELKNQLYAPEEQVFVQESQLFALASFYHMLSTKPLGKHVIRFCESAPCHVVGGRELWQALQDALGIKAGETTSDGKWSLITTSCLGMCGVGPVLVIDDDIYGNVTPDQLTGILEKYP